MTGLVRGGVIAAAVIVFLVIGVVLGSAVLSNPEPQGDCDLQGPTSGFVDDNDCPISQDAYDEWSECEAGGLVEDPLRLLVAVGAGVVGGAGAFVVTGRSQKKAPKGR